MVLSEENIGFLKNKFPNVKFAGNTIKSVSDIPSEYEILKHGAALRINKSSVLKLTGKDVVDFIHRISTNDLRNLTDNTKVTTLFTNEKGRIIDRTVFIKFTDYSLLLGHISAEAKLLRWIEKFIIMEDVRVTDITESYNIFELIGPQAESYLTLLCGKCIDLLNSSNVIEVTFEGNLLKILKLKEIQGADKFLILVQSGNFNSVIHNFLEQQSVFDFGLIVEDAYNFYRIESGIPVAPNELNDNYNPHEANVIGDVSFTKGCYIGQEVIARLDTYNKVQKQLKNFVIKTDFEFNGDLLNVFNHDGEDIGLITSLARCVKTNSIIGLGYVSKKSDDIHHGKINVMNNDIDIEIKTLNL